MIFLWFSYDFIMTFPWLSRDFIMTFLWLSHDFIMTFLWISHEFFMNFSWFSKDFLMSFSGHSNDFLMTFSWSDVICEQPLIIIVFVEQTLCSPGRVILVVPNRYTRLENLVWSHCVFWPFIFCRKRRFMKPLLLYCVDTFYLFNIFFPLIFYPLLNFLQILKW